MAGMDRDLSSPLGVFFLVSFGIESVVSLLGNGFILAVSGHSCLRSKKMLPCDFLLTTLSLLRFLLQCVSLSDKYIYISFPETYLYSKEQEALAVSWIYLNTASLWCATCLNVFYCVKVANFTHPLFLWLKLRIGLLVPRFLGIFLLAFIICSIYPVMRHFEDKKCQNLTGNLPENISQKEGHGTYCVTDVLTFNLLNTLQIYLTAISFSICLTASIVLLLSLWRHTRNLKKGGLSTKDLSIQCHLNVMKPLFLSIFFYILHFAAMILVFCRVLKYGKVERLISDIFLSSYPSAHSVILIFTNPKLRKVCTHVLNLRSAS